MATLGDPLTDLGLMLVYWDPVCAAVLPYGHPFAGNEHVPSAMHVAELYRDASGCSLEHLDFYRALGYFKLAVIAEGIHGRFLAGLTVGEGFETVGLAVEQLLARGLDVLPAMTGTTLG
jgi:aminoglycoside phosphotransferase (APT) family kinase protein